MANKFQNIELRSLGFSILSKEQNLNINLRGGGGVPQSKISTVSPQSHPRTSSFIAKQEEQQQYQQQPQTQQPNVIQLEEIIKLILLRGPPQRSQQQQFNRVQEILTTILKYIDNYGNIQNQMLSLLIFEQLGQHYQSELDQINYVTDPQTIRLEGLTYQYDIMNTSKQHRKMIDNDRNFNDLKKLEYQFNSIEQLINNIKKIEMQLIVSELFEFKVYSSLMIYKLKYCFEKLFWIYYNYDKTIVSNELYEKVILNSKSQHLYNQWITLISNLYVIRPVENSNQNNNLINNKQIFRVLDNQRGILLFQNIKNYDQQLQSKYNIYQKYKIIDSLKNIKYLQFEIQEEKYFDNQIEIIKRNLINNFKNYGQSEAIQPFLEHIKTEQSNSKDPQIVKLKNIYINIMIDYIRILISFNSIYNQCTLVNNFDSQSLNQFQNQYQVFQNNLGNKWESMVKLISEKINGINSQEELNLEKEINEMVKQINPKQQIEVNFLKENRNCLVDTLNYYRKLMQILLKLIDKANGSLQNQSISKEQKSQNYLQIIFTYELIQKLNNYYLINLKQIFLQILNLHHNINGISETIELFKKILRQETQIKNLFSDQQYINTKLFQQETEEQKDKEQLNNKCQYDANKIFNENQKILLKELKEIYNDNLQIQVNLQQQSNIENYNKLIVFVLQLFQYPLQFKLSYHNQRKSENLVLQLIKVLSLCSETYIFEFAFGILIDIWYENQFNKLMLDDYIVQLIENLQGCIQFNIQYLKDKVNLNLLNQKIVDQGIKQWQVLYVKNKIHSNLFQQDEQQQEFNNIFMNKIKKFLEQFSPLRFDYEQEIKNKQQVQNNNKLSFDELINLRQEMIIESQLQSIQNDKYIVDLMCKNSNSQENTQANNLNQEIKNFLVQKESKILIIYGEDGPDKITLANQTQEFLWQQYKQAENLIPIKIFVDIDNLSEIKIQAIIQKQLRLQNDVKSNNYSFLFLIIIQEDQNNKQIIESVNLMKLLITGPYSKSKIMCLMRSEILKCKEYKDYVNVIYQNDQSYLLQLKIEKATISQVIQMKLKKCIIKFLREQDILIDSNKFESIWILLTLIIKNKEIQNDSLLDDFQIDLILELLEYHFSINSQQNNHQENFKSKIKELRSQQYYENKIKELNLQNIISKTQLLVIILEFLPSMDTNYKIEDYLTKNFTFLYYQQALIYKQNYGDNVNEIQFYQQKAQDYFNDLNKKHQLQVKPSMQEKNNEPMKNLLDKKFCLYQIYQYYIYFKFSQNVNFQNEVDKFYFFYLEKAFQTAKPSKITIDNNNKKYLDISIIEYNIDIGYQFIHSSLQDYFISKFILDLLTTIEFTDLTIKMNDSLQEQLNQYNLSNQQYNGIFKFLTDEIRMRFLDSKLLKLIKSLMGKEDKIKALSNAFYLYSKIFGIIKEDNFENIKLKDISLEGCSFYKVNLNNSVFQNVNITNCNFVYCSLENVKWENLIINNYQKFQNNPKDLLISKTGEWVIYFKENDNRIFKEELKGSKEPIFKPLRLKAISIAISDNDELLAIGSNQSILLFNTKNFQEKDRIIEQPDKGDIKYLVFIQNDEQLIYSNSNKQLVQLNIKNKIEELKTFNTDNTVNIMAFSSLNNILAFSSEKIIKLYNVQERKDPIQLVELQQKVLTLAFQSNNSLISCCQNGYVQFWDIQSKKNIKVIQLYNIIPLLLSPNGKLIVYKDHQNYIKLCDLEYPEVVYSFNGNQVKDNQVKENQVQFSKDGTKIAINSQVQDISGIQNKADDNIRCIEISPDGVHYAIGQNSKISICDSKGGIGIDKLKGHTGAINAIAYSSDAMQLVSVGDDKQVIYWDIYYCKIINKHQDHQSNVLSVAISEDKQYIASGEINGIIILQKIEPWEIISQIKASMDNNKINSLSFDNDSLYLASGNADKQIILWKISEQGFQDQHTFNGHTDEVRCVTFSKDRKLLASCSNDKSIRLWDVIEKQYLFNIDGHRDHVINIKFTRNNQIWSCSKDNTIRLWDIEQKIMIIKLDQNTSNIKSIALNPDNKYLLSLSDNQSIKLWDLNGFYQKEEQIKQQKTIKTIALSPDGNIIAQSGDNNIIQLLDVTTKQPINHLQIDGIVNSLLFQGQHYLICVVKIINTDKIIKWDLKNNEKKLLGDGSIIAISLDSQQLAYAKSKTLTIILGDKVQKVLNITKEIKLLCFSSKDNILACISDKNIIIWNYKEGTQKSTIKFNGVIEQCSFASDGMWFAFSGGDSTISFCSTEKFGKEQEFILESQKKYEIKDKKIQNILISNQYFIVLFDNEIKVLDPTQNEIIPQSQFCQQNQILNIAISSNGEKLIVLNKNFSIDLIKIKILNEYEQQYKADVVCFYSNGEQLLSGCGKKIEIINLQNSKNNKSNTLDFQIKSIILSQRNNKIAIAGEKQIKIFDSNLKDLNKIRNENNIIQSMIFSSVETHIAYICQDQIKLWDLNANKDENTKFKDFIKKPFGLIQFFNNIFNLLIVTNDQLIVFDLVKKVETQQFKYNQSKISVITISKDDKTIAAGCEDGKIRLWNQSDQNQSDWKYFDLDCKSKIICLDIKSGELASVEIDKSITIWSIKEKRKIYQIQTPDKSQINCIKYNPIKNELVLSGNSGKVYFWQIDLPTLFEHYFLIEDNIINYSISSAGKKLAVQSLFDSNIYINDVTKGTYKLIIKDKSIQSYLKLSDQGNKLAYFFCKDFKLTVYDLQTNSVTNYKDIFKNKINTIDFSKDEKQFIIGYSDGSIQLFQDKKTNNYKQNNSNITQLIFYDNKFIAQLNQDYIYLLKLSPIFGLDKQTQEKNGNYIRIKLLEENKLIVQKAGLQFEILDKELKQSGFATREQINTSLINIENSQWLWKYRIGYIELNPRCRTFPIIFTKINQESKFTLQNNIDIYEYFDRQFI